MQHNPRKALTLLLSVVFWWLTTLSVANQGSSHYALHWVSFAFGLAIGAMLFMTFGFRYSSRETNEDPGSHKPTTSPNPATSLQSQSSEFMS